MIKILQRRKFDSGQALVEFALVLPVLLLLIFGSIEFGRIFHATHVITSAAREGARAAAVGGNDNPFIETKIEGAVSSLVSNPANVVAYPPGTDSGEYDHIATKPPKGYIYFTIDPYSKTSRTGDISVDIKVKGAVEIVVPLISLIIQENPKIIKGEAQMRLE